MAEFFNRKEEVIDLQLTQHGKRLLAQGVLQPVYYSFHDEDILYDGGYGGVTEEQNDIHDRIKSAVRPKTQYVFAGIESNINLSVDAKILNNYATPLVNKSFVTAEDRLDVLPYCLGTTDPNTNNAPAWGIGVYRAQISSSAAYYSGSAGNINIPQLNVIHQINTYVGLDETEAKIQNFDGPADAAAKLLYAQDTFETDQGQPAQVFQISNKFQDGTFLFEDQDYVFADLRENNTTNMVQNFDLEIFEVTYETDDKTGATKEIITQMKFMPDPFIEDTGIVDEEELNYQYATPTPEYVEYYFDLNVDEEIEDRILCQVDFENKKESIFADSRLEFDCAPYQYLDEPGNPPVLEDPC